MLNLRTALRFHGPQTKRQSKSPSRRAQPSREKKSNPMSDWPKFGEWPKSEHSEYPKFGEWPKLGHSEYAYAHLDEVKPIPRTLIDMLKSGIYTEQRDEFVKYYLYKHPEYDGNMPEKWLSGADRDNLFQEFYRTLENANEITKKKILDDYYKTLKRSKSIRGCIGRNCTIMGGKYRKTKRYNKRRKYNKSRKY